MPEIRHTVAINASPDKVYAALTEQKHLAGWWTPDCTADAFVGGQARFEFKAADGTLDGYGVMQIEKLVLDELVEWKCVVQEYKEEKDWIGTTIRFCLSTDGHGGTILDFVHTGLEGDCYDRCSDGWNFVLKTSLKSYLETGRGVPYLAHVEYNAVQGK